jgi:sensor histidine kinase YesM
LDYIAVFASLLRNQLNQSLKTIIPLSEELQTLRYYIELEKIRLGPDYVFSYEAPNDEALQAYSIPPMTLQPLVENAIAHGVSPNGKGLIRIVVHLTDRALTVMVEDNGIGRKAALSKQNKEKQYGQMTKSSLALKNLQQRLLLLQQLEGLAVSLQMEDLQDEQGQAKGTRVVLRWS